MSAHRSPPYRDRFGRPLRSLRVSVTDRCNLRCSYCMPEEEYAWLPREEILSFEEIARLARVFVSTGVEKLRLTGGEPLLRRDLPTLVALLAEIDGVRDLALTTNAVRLADLADELARAGLGRLTISLDTLDAERYASLTKRDALADTLEGIAAAREAGFRGTKINTVVMRGVNDDELVELVEFGRAQGAEVRFIEYMDVDGATHWSMERVVPKAEILERLAARYGAPRPVETSDAAAPADRFAFGTGERETVVGVIASTTEPFCAACDRSRLTADGRWYTCLYATSGRDLARPLRAGASDAELAALVRGRWSERDDRGAEERLRPDRTPRRSSELRADPHLEMHTRGG